MTDGSELIAAHFDELDEHLRRQGEELGLAEIHGMACGLVCAGREHHDARDWQALVGSMAERSDIQRVLGSVFSLAHKALGSTGFEFQPLLPDEQLPAARRVEAIADWSSGFGQAYSRAGGSPSDPQAAEALEDIRAIAGMVGDDDDETTQHRNLAQIEEYLRVAVQLLFDESR